MANDPRIITGQSMRVQYFEPRRPRFAGFTSRALPIISRVQDTWPPPEGVPVYVTMRDDGTVYWERADGK